jgi:hypothetical protein
MAVSVSNSNADVGEMCQTHIKVEICIKKAVSFDDQKPPFVGCHSCDTADHSLPDHYTGREVST